MKNQNIFQKSKITNLPLDVDSHDQLILCIGDDDGVFGFKEAMQILARAEVKNVTLLIVGYKKSIHYWRYRLMAFFYNLKFEGEKHIIITTLNRSKTKVAFQKADIFLHLTSRKISLDILHEAMASKTPFMVSPIGKAREIVELANGGGLLLPGQKIGGTFYVNLRHSAHYLTLLLNDKDKLKVMAERGFQAWLQTQ